MAVLCRGRGLLPRLWYAHGLAPQWGRKWWVMRAGAYISLGLQCWRLWPCCVLFGFAGLGKAQGSMRSRVTPGVTVGRSEFGQACSTHWGITVRSRRGRNV